MTRIAAIEAVVWIDNETHEIQIRNVKWGEVESRNWRGRWSDPIGAHYTQWREMSDADRVLLMLETVIDLAMMGFPMVQLLKAFDTIEEFHALGRRSYPMCRALTAALVGERLEPNTMSFDELLEHWEPRR
jgi:hypothetical protein